MTLLLIQLSFMDSAILFGIAWLILTTLPTTNKKLREELKIQRSINSQNQSTIKTLEIEKDAERENFKNYRIDNEKAWKRNNKEIDKMRIEMNVLRGLIKISKEDFSKLVKEKIDKNEHTN